jgi:uncharacterized protein (DUF1501 family)
MAHDPACRDFHRTDAQRRTLLDRPISRRSLLQLGLGATIGFYTSRALPLGEHLDAAHAAAAAAPDATALVHVFVPGGVDLLDTLSPLGQLGRYADLRRTLHVEDALAIEGGSLGLHPSLGQGVGGGLKGVYDRGQLGLIPGIDYADPDLSHFSSRHFWETGILDFQADSGWLARWAARHGNAHNPFQALSMSGALSPVLRGSRAPAAAVSSPESAQVWIPGVWGRFEDRTLRAYSALRAAAPKAAGPAAVTASLRESRTVAERLKPYVKPEKGPDPMRSPVAYPDASTDAGFGDRLRMLAALLAEPLGVRVATVDATFGNFDTHDGQKDGLRTGLATLSAGLSAFQADLVARGIADRVLTFVWTEFGRRPKENSSGGTDHGAGGVAFVMGGRVRPGILSDYPSLTDFDGDRNLRVTCDFRTVYASLLEQWLGTPAGDVLPDAGSVGRLQVVR